MKIYRVTVITGYLITTQQISSFYMWFQLITCTIVIHTYFLCIYWSERHYSVKHWCFGHKIDEMCMKNSPQAHSPQKWHPCQWLREIVFGPSLMNSSISDNIYSLWPTDVLYLYHKCLTHWPLGDLDVILKQLKISILFYWLVSSHRLMKMSWDECHETSPISQHWFR